MRILFEYPVRRDVELLGKDYLDSVRGRQVHHAVIIPPVVLPWRHLYRPPGDPVPEGVHADLSRGLMIPCPVLLGWIGLAEIDRAIRKDGVVGGKRR